MANIERLTAHTDHASQAAPRELVSRASRTGGGVPSVTTPLYATSISHALRRTLRGGVVRQLLRTPCLRTSGNSSYEHFIGGTSANRPSVNFGEAQFFEVRC